ncbi:MAG TPA: hypothetical protein V6C85_26655 [Allocoleopsis sp.]
MNIFQKNLAVTLKRFGLQSRWLAKETKTDEGSISKYIGGKRDIYTATLEKWYGALPVEAQEHFLEACLEKKIVMRERSLTEMIDRLDPNNPQDCKQVADALRLIAVRFFPEPPTSQDRDSMENRKTTDESKYLASLQSR